MINAANMYHEYREAGYELGDALSEVVFITGVSRNELAEYLYNHSN